MIDINLIRENPKLVRENIKNRFQKELISEVDEFLKLDDTWKKDKKKLDELRHRRNILSKEINEAKKQGGDIKKLIKEAKELPNKINDLEKKNNEIKEKIDSIHSKLPNILHKKVPIGEDESKNKVLRKWGVIKKPKFKLKNHVELLEDLGIADFDAGSSNSGRGFNYLKKEIALLDFALQRYGIDFLLKKGFDYVVPPMMLRFNTLLGALNGLKDFEDVVYKIENEDLYVIGTAEHSLVSMLKNKEMKKEKLPIKVCALTPCFRKEIGAHGVDSKGLFRMHQFNKVEQVTFSTEEDSFKMMEEMNKISEKFFQSLKIPYRVIEICSGDLGNKFSRQFDIEAWFPRQNSYKEVTSAGNCTDFQARALNIKYSNKSERKYCHISNNTMIATSRGMVAILENFQQKDGSIKIPTILQKYTGFKKISKE
ncbi:MAG: serine--tRNA ligase [Candidatus Nanoarchaeia archaeon]|jgi:seryl-tRNA synthetase|nr:serine--tRNA ligase [Candidatus Nanoarchaeia archaeon]|tara:strand:- start:38442 stop:39719 length:1278 start_codon:yes stop_codon:yes gene_type:complete